MSLGIMHNAVGTLTFSKTEKMLLSSTNDALSVVYAERRYTDCRFA
jgi:hypothetical protein